MKKKCFRCGIVQPLSDFYAHAQMADGHLNKCKTCNKKDTDARRLKLEATDPEWVERERERHRVKTARKRVLAGKIVLRNEERREKLRITEAGQTARKIAKGLVGYNKRTAKLIPQKCERCGFPITEAHHEDYQKPLEVTWLCKRHHMDRHIEINNARLIAA